MKRAAQIALKKCLGVKKSDKVLIITDKPRKKIAEIFFYEAIKLARNVMLITIPVGDIDGQEPPKLIAQAMKKYGVQLLITTKSLSHTNARKAASKLGARMASLPGITRQTINRAIPVDYNAMSKLNKKLANALKKANKVKIISKKGTDLTFNAKNRKIGDDNGIYTKKGFFGNLPAGEVCLAPKEGTTNGILVIDASILNERLKTPITIEIKNGYAKKITGKVQAKKLLKTIKPLGKSAFNIAEFGIGTNPKAKITGNILEDEKVKGTCHLALGNSTGLGGKIYAKCHLDGIIKNPTIFFDKKCIMKNGKFLI